MGDQPMAPRGVIAVKEKENIKGHEWGSTTSTLNGESGDSGTSCKNFVPRWEACVEALRPGVIVKWDGTSKEKKQERQIIVS